VMCQYEPATIVKSHMLGLRDSGPERTLPAPEGGFPPGAFPGIGGGGGGPPAPLPMGGMGGGGGGGGGMVSCAVRSRAFTPLRCWP